MNNFTTYAMRDIRQFVAKTEKEAKKHKSDIQKMLKKGQTDKIIERINKNSLRPEKDGLIVNIMQNDNIPGLGIDPVYSSEVWKAKVGSVSNIFTSKGGDITFFYIEEDKPSSVKLLSEVEPQIRSQLQRKNLNTKIEQTKNDLITEYGVVVHYDKLISLITPEALFNLGEEAQQRNSFQEAIAYYDQIIADFSDTDHAYKALFMKAFITTENLRDTNKAIDLFEELLKKYPIGDLNESATFMLEALKAGDNIDVMFNE
jgi:tetratricopeptide (TPR) repeat protein